MMSFSRVFRHPPRAARRKHRTAGSTRITLRMPTREPFNANWVFSFLGRRAFPGVETCMATRTGDGSGADRISVSRRDGALWLEMPGALADGTADVLARVRRVFDLDADPDAIDSHLLQSPAAHPGFASLRAFVFRGHGTPSKAPSGLSSGNRSASTVPPTWQPGSLRDSAPAGFRRPRRSQAPTWAQSGYPGRGLPRCDSWRARYSNGAMPSCSIHRRRAKHCSVSMASGPGPPNTWPCASPGTRTPFPPRTGPCARSSERTRATLCDVRRRGAPGVPTRSCTSGAVIPASGSDLWRLFQGRRARSRHQRGTDMYYTWQEVL